MTKKKVKFYALNIIKSHCFNSFGCIQYNNYGRIAAFSLVILTCECNAEKYFSGSLRAITV